MEFPVHKMTELQIGGSIVKGKAGNKGELGGREGFLEKATCLQMGSSALGC